MLFSRRWIRCASLVVAVSLTLWASAAEAKKRSNKKQSPQKSSVEASAVKKAAAPSYPSPPAFVPGSWSLVVMPDTQCYTDEFPGLLTLQTHWIAKNKDKYNIRYVVGVGDVTNWNKDIEWQRASEAFAELDGIVPYAITTGNHDYTPHGDAVLGKTGLNRFFPVSRFEKWPTFGGVMTKNETINNYHLFSAGGTDWIILCLEWATQDKTIEWANKILAKYPQRKAIVTTHAYLYPDGTRYDFATKGRSQKCSPHEYYIDREERWRHNNPNGEKTARTINDAEELWQKLVKKNNVAIVLSGHVCVHKVGFLTSRNDQGKQVQQILVDYQSRELGGEGYFRILEFLPDGKTVRSRTYSPFYDKHLSDPGNQFSVQLDP